MRRCPVFDDESQDMLSTIIRKIENFQQESKTVVNQRILCKPFLVYFFAKECLCAQILSLLIYSPRKVELEKPFSVKILPKTKFLTKSL